MRNVLLLFVNDHIRRKIRFELNFLSEVEAFSKFPFIELVGSTWGYTNHNFTALWPSLHWSSSSKKLSTKVWVVQVSQSPPRKWDRMWVIQVSIDIYPNSFCVRDVYFSFSAHLDNRSETVHVAYTWSNLNGKSYTHLIARDFTKMSPYEELVALHCCFYLHSHASSGTLLHILRTYDIFVYFALVPSHALGA